MQELRDKATWIWYPGDFEIWLGNIFNNRRTERGAMLPPFWKQDSHWPTVVFTKSYDLEEDESVSMACEGRISLTLDGALQTFRSAEGRLQGKNFQLSTFNFTLPKGHHTLALKIWNQATPPALYISGKTVKTDSSWLVTYEDKIWIDENGEAHGSGTYVPAASWCFDRIDTPPSQYRLEQRRQQAVASTAKAGGALYDFGRETFGYIRFARLRGSGSLHIYYGESAAEALDKDHCETLDHCEVSARGLTAPVGSKAFRYVYIEKDPGVSFDRVMMDYEYLPHDPARSGSFRSSDEELNRIWQVAAYTMDLTTREFFVDGIKRDRWTWSGDALQSYLVNFYLRGDSECVKRTIRQLRGKDPVTSHINTIMDYTFFWLISTDRYYWYTGDGDFYREIYPKMASLMAYVESRLNSEGMAEGQPGDWIFVDWTDFPMRRRGALCFQQILLSAALLAMARGSSITGRASEAGAWYQKAARLRQKIRQTFWDEAAGAFMHAVEGGRLNRQITRYPNMFAILYGLADERMRRKILRGVLENPQAEPVTTPYMRFYELEALSLMNRQPQVLSAIKAYWGGMLREGATTFWEKYDPKEKGAQYLAMYGRRYGKEEE